MAHSLNKQPWVATQQDSNGDAAFHVNNRDKRAPTEQTEWRGLFLQFVCRVEAVHPVVELSSA